MSYSWEGHFDQCPSKGGVPLGTDVVLRRHGVHVCEPFTRLVEASPKAFLFMGAPGSGKSGLPEFCRLLRGANNPIVVDPDTYKKSLPEYQGGRGSELVHEESSWVAKQILATLMGRRTSFINDSVGRDWQKYANLARRLKENGFTVELFCVHVLDIDELFRRVEARRRKTGRQVPQEVVREAHEAIPLGFARLRKEVDASFLFDGATGELAWSSVDGAVNDIEFVSKVSKDLVQ